MNQRTRLLTALVTIALAAVALAMVLAQCGARPKPAIVTPGAVTATTAPSSAAEGPGVPTASTGPTPTFTREEELVATSQHDSSQSVSFPEECSEVLKDEPWCNVTKSAERIKRPEWEDLFPQTEFYLVKYDLYGGESVQEHNLLIIVQDSQRYTVDAFDRLLAVNGIAEITDENHELVAKAFALMTLADYLEGKVVFTEWTEGDWPASFGRSFNYALVAWTEIQGLQISWGFRFQDGRLKEVEGIWFSESQVGDYIDVPFYSLPLPSSRVYYFEGGNP